MSNHNHTALSDSELLTATRRAAGVERRATAALIALLAEVDSRRLYLGEGFSSMFAYCTRALLLSEPAAYARITAARVARRFPQILELLENGSISLTTVGLLAPHLDSDNQERILGAARDLSKRGVEQLVAAIQPQPDISSSVRALPATTRLTGQDARSPVAGAQPPRVVAPPAPSELVAPASRRALVAPIAPRRYLIRVTVSEGTNDTLERLRALLRHQVPNGDPAVIIDRALTLLLKHVEQTKLAATERPRPGNSREPWSPSHSRGIPAAVRREVWARDEGRCA